MDWILAGLGAAIASAVVTVLNKIILERHVASAELFVIVSGVMHLPGALLLLVFVSFPGYDLAVLGLAVGSGAAWGTSLVVMFSMLRRQNVSIVTAVYQTAPVFVAVIAVIFLSERLGAAHWIAIFVTVAGAVLISLRRTRTGGGLVLGTWFFMMIVSSGLLAVGMTLSKAALDQGMSVWNLHTVRSLGVATVMVLLMLRRNTAAELIELLRNRTGLALCVVTEGGLAFAALYLTTLAIAMGPVALASTVLSARPMFVFLFGIILSLGIFKILSEPLDRASLIHRAVAIAMIFAGIATISVL